MLPAKSGLTGNSVKRLLKNSWVRSIFDLRINSPSASAHNWIWKLNGTTFVYSMGRCRLGTAACHRLLGCGCFHLGTNNKISDESKWSSVLLGFRRHRTALNICKELHWRASFVRRSCCISLYYNASSRLQHVQENLFSFKFTVHLLS